MRGGEGRGGEGGREGREGGREGGRDVGQTLFYFRVLKRGFRNK